MNDLTMSKKKSVFKFPKITSYFYFLRGKSTRACTGDA